MTAAIHDLLKSFDSLTDPEKRELAAEILRRSARFDTLPLSNEELIRAADDVLSVLDQEEACNAKSPAR